MWQSDLPRHIIKLDKDETSVKEAAALPKKSIERKHAFEVFRKKGILMENRMQANQENPQFTSERCQSAAKGNLVLCSNCSGFYGKKLFYRHKEKCIRESAEVPKPVSFSIFQSHKKDTMFGKEVLSCFQNTQLGQLCREDETIVTVGERLFQKNFRKVDKLQETRKSVMSDMRLLGKLFLAFKSGQEDSTLDMFKRTNFKRLEAAIEEITISEKKELKYGVKHKLYYLIKNAGGIIMAENLAKGDDSLSSEVEKFLHLLKLNQNVIFGDAAYEINKSRQTKLRMPEQQASEEDVRKIRDLSLARIQTLSDNFAITDKHSFVQLRDALVCRITLFNARRGGEPCRLKLSAWHDALSNRWVNKSQVEELMAEEKELFKDMLVAYQPGKGNHLVPVLFPKDCIKGMEIMTDKDIRKEVGVNTANDYVFPNTEMSYYHVSGWAAIKAICDEAEIEDPALLTASKQRHRVSTLFAGLHLSGDVREAFYSHMGHSESTNKGTYQYPLVVREMVQVGKHLKDIDHGMKHDFQRLCYF